MAIDLSNFVELAFNTSSSIVGGLEKDFTFVEFGDPVWDSNKAENVRPRNPTDAKGFIFEKTSRDQDLVVTQEFSHKILIPYSRLNYVPTLQGQVETSESVFGIVTVETDPTGNALLTLMVKRLGPSNL